jgi:site-specific DNA-methyltransferase (adenine-specific)
MRDRLYLALSADSRRTIFAQSRSGLIAAEDQAVLGSYQVSTIKRRNTSGPANFTLSQADAVQWLVKLKPGSVDLMITDPAYESLEKHRAIGTTTRLKRSNGSSNPWFPIFPNSRLPELFRAAFRALRRDSHLYMFCDPDTLWAAVPAAQDAGFRFWKPIVWDKMVFGMGYHYRRQYEFILFFEKGKRRLADLSISDVLRAKRVRNGYPTEKPVELLQTLVTQSSDVGERVCDPFLGSGATGVAAVLEGRAFVGADLTAASVALAETRLRATQAASSSRPLRRNSVAN